MSTKRPSKNERRDAAREKARVLREQQLRRQRRNKVLLQGGIALGVLAIVAIVALVIVNSVRPPGPGPANMASNGITIGEGFTAVRTEALAAGAEPAARQTPPDGVIDIRLYEDFVCPACGQFEATNAAQIQQLVEEGKATVEYLPVAFLDRASQGSRYSSRAANAAAAVANHSPDSFFAFHKLLFENQPEEGTTGLSDEQLVQYAEEAGASNLPQIRQDIQDRTYFSWVADATEDFLDGRYEGVSETLAPEQVGTPLVIVDGQRYTGSITDPTAFQSFLLETSSAYEPDASASPSPSPSPSAEE